MQICIIAITALTELFCLVATGSFSDVQFHDQLKLLPGDHGCRCSLHIMLCLWARWRWGTQISLPMPAVTVKVLLGGGGGC